MTMAARIVRMASNIDRYAFQICGVCIFMIMVVGAADVVLGNTIGYRPPGTVDVSQSLFVVSIFLALPHVVLRQEHIKVDLFINVLPVSVQRLCEWSATLISCAVYAAMAYAMWDLFAASWEVKEQSLSIFTFPIYPVKFAATAGLFVAALICLCRFFMLALRKV